MRLGGLPTTTKSNGATRQHQHQHQHQQHNQQQAQQFHRHQLPLPPLGFPIQNAQQHWTRLNTLAEVSNQELRNTSLNENGEDNEHSQDHGASASGNVDSGSYQMEEAFMLSSPPALQQRDSEDQAQQGQSANQEDACIYIYLSIYQILTPQADMVKHERQGSAENDGRAPSGQDSVSSDHISNVAVAAAATARLNSAANNHDDVSYDDLSARLVEAIDSNGSNPDSRTVLDETTVNSDAVPNPSVHREQAMSRHASPLSGSATSTPDARRPEVPIAENQPPAPFTSSEPPAATAPTQHPQLPWGEMAYMSSSAASQRAANTQPLMGLPTQSVFRFNQDGSKGEHSRQRFSENRRQEVKALRKLGACVRCKTLRKTCSQGDPCDTCRKILSPRHWRIGCFRVKKTAKLNSFNSRLSEAMLETLVQDKAANMKLDYPVVIIEASLAGSDKSLVMEASVGTNLGEMVDPTELDEHRTIHMHVAMIDPRAIVDEELPVYAAEIMRPLVHKAPESFCRVTLESALAMLDAAEKMLDPPQDIKNLKLALDLWTYIAIMDSREDWTFEARATGEATRFIRHLKTTSTTNAENYKLMALRLTAEAEKLAETLSQKLLDQMLRDLQDAKVKIGPAMYFSILLFLICVEKTTWMLLSWERLLGDKWPLKKQANEFAELGQADALADLLRMLLIIRRALPKLEVDNAGILGVSSSSPYHSYFEQLGLKGK